MTKEFKPIIGIDLGTTFCTMAYIDEHDKPVIIMNQEGRPATPSVVHFYDNERFEVGEIAVNMLLIEPENTVSFIKRQIGGDSFRRNIYGKEYTPQELSALILKKLKQDAEEYFKNKGLVLEVKDVVITVPAYFGMEQKGATKEAGEIAGLNVLMIINEPTAAALTYVVNKLGEQQTVFVFDLGGGTFDVTILEVKNNVVTMLASDGDPELGGKDWDDVLVNYCATKFKEKFGDDPQDDPQSYQGLYEKVLKAKIFLSKMEKTIVQVSHNGNRENIEITRVLFADLSKDLMSQCELLSSRVMKKANKEWKDIDNVLLVGGSTYMPMIKDMIKNTSGKKPSLEVNPDHCVAIGAAYQAKYKYIDDVAVKQEKSAGNIDVFKKEMRGSLPDIKIQECVAKSLGVIILRDNTEVVFEMISEGTVVPFAVTNKFSYSCDNQTGVNATITEGKGETKDEVKVIGEVLLSGLSPKKKGDPLDIVYKYNLDKILEVEVIDEATGKSQKGKIVLEGSMTEEEKEVARMNIAEKRVV